jgi:hypothetical protein
MMELLTGQIPGLIKNPFGIVGAEMLFEDIAKTVLHQPVHLDPGKLSQIWATHLDIAEQIPEKPVFSCVVFNHNSSEKLISIYQQCPVWYLQLAPPLLTGLRAKALRRASGRGLGGG